MDEQTARLPLLSELPAGPIITGMAGRRTPGTGAKVLWLHGYTLDSSSWGAMWHLLPGWRHIGIDLPGHGASAPMSADSDLRRLGRLLAGFCIEEDIRHIVALSFGTITALQIAIELPRHFASIVLGAPSVAGGPQDPEVGRVYMRLFQLYHQAAAAAAMRDAWMNCRAWAGVEKYPGLRDALGSLVLKHRWLELRSLSTRLFTYPPQQPEDIARIETPILLLVGDRELTAFKQCADLIQRTAARCTCRELVDTDHLCMLMSPQPSARFIADHLRAHGAGPDIANNGQSAAPVR